jgi:hypothetical protein
MAHRITPEQHIEEFFRTAPLEQCAIQRDRIELILRVRGGIPAPAKRGRPRKKAEGPITTKDGTA